MPRENLSPAIRKYRDFKDMVPGAPIYQREFGFYSLEQWREHEGLPADADLAQLFGYDDPATLNLGQLGWCEAAFVPDFPTVTLEDRGEYELVQDFAGRHVLYFKGRRDGFMPEYVDHPVKDMATWEKDVLWRLDPTSPERWKDWDAHTARLVEEARKGKYVVQGLVGGYMYLRSLIGPEELLYAFYDQPELIHACMEAWFKLADVVIARHQQHVTIEEIFFAEDICYNAGPLISPDMMREFLLPYYQQVINNLKSRQIDKSRHLSVQIDTDGDARSVIDVYVESIGMDMMSPFEVASCGDIVPIARQYPELRVTGGIDKRVLAQGPAAIDEMVERIIPAMRERGGYIPTCDHGVPAEVTLENYMHYRKRALELGL